MAETQGDEKGSDWIKHKTRPNEFGSTGPSIYFGPLRKFGFFFKWVAGIGKIILAKWLPGYRECLNIQIFQDMYYPSFLTLAITFKEKLKTVILDF